MSNFADQHARWTIADLLALRKQGGPDRRIPECRSRLDFVLLAYIALLPPLTHDIVPRDLSRVPQLGATSRTANSITQKNASLNYEVDANSARREVVDAWLAARRAVLRCMVCGLAPKSE